MPTAPTLDIEHQVSQQFIDAAPARICVDKQEQSMFASLVEKSADFIATMALDGTPVYLNEGGRKLVGMCPADSIRNKPLTSFFCPASQELIEKEALPQVTQSGLWEGELLMRGIGRASCRERVSYHV